jgi:hypothetical protein
MARIARGETSATKVFTVTHSFHPLHGQTFEVVAVLNIWGGDRVAFTGADGCWRSLPAEWTDTVTPELVVTLGADRAHFRADYLLGLRKLLNNLADRQEGSAC